MMIWTFHEARNAGYEIPEKTLTELTAWTLDPKSTAKILPTPGETRPGPECVNLVAAALVPALLADGTGKAAKTERLPELVQHFLSKQDPKGGGWIAPEGRSPILNESDAATALVAYGLVGAADVSADSKRIAESLKKAAGRLAEAEKKNDPQTDAYLLLHAVRSKRGEAEIGRLRDRILARQQKDGGWSQTESMKSDAYATGQAIYALRKAAVPASHPAIRGGSDFLLKNQRASGEWLMVSRPMKPGGKGAGNIRPIVYAGTAWGTLGLISAHPRTPQP